MSDDNYVTQLAASLLDVQLLDGAFAKWIKAIPGEEARMARTVVALACVDLLAEHTAREVMAAEDDTPTNVRPLFERQARTDGHPSAGMGWRA